MEEKFVFTKDQLDFIEQNQALIESRDYSQILAIGSAEVVQPLVILIWSLDQENQIKPIIRFSDEDISPNSEGFKAFIELDGNLLFLYDNRIRHYPLSMTGVEKAKECITDKLKFYHLPQEVIDKVLGASIFTEIQTILANQPVPNNYSSNALNSKAINSYWPDPDDTTIPKITHNYYESEWSPSRLRDEIKKLQQSLIELSALQNNKE